MYFLHGFLETLEDLYLKPKEIGYLADKIVDFQVGIAEGLKPFKDKIHGIALCDDWGTQNSTFISVDLWRKFFKKRYKAIFEAYHSGNRYN